MTTLFLLLALLTAAVAAGTDNRGRQLRRVAWAIVAFVAAVCAAVEKG